MNRLICVRSTNGGVSETLLCMKSPNGGLVRGSYVVVVKWNLSLVGHSVCKGCMDKSTMLSGENLACPKCNLLLESMSMSSFSSWRGVGVKGSAGARDEYHYAPPIIKSCCYVMNS